VQNEVGRTYGTHGRGERVYKVVVGKSERQIPLGRPTCGWDDGIRMDLKEINWRYCVEWIELAKDRNLWRALVDAMINHRVLAPWSQLLSEFVRSFVS
jgi:hypothetical protein